MRTRSDRLADRILEGAELLANFAAQLTDAQWNTVVQPDGRTVGVLVHHVANLYPIEMDVIRVAVAGHAIEGLTWEGIAQLNAEHALKFALVSKEEALAFLARTSRAAAAEVRLLSDAELDRAVPFSLSGDAPMTVQFIIEDHPLKHAWHHLAGIRQALGEVVVRLERAA